MTDTADTKAGADDISESDTQFLVHLVASDHPVWSGPARYAVIPDAMGRMGFLPKHEPILTSLEKGVVRITDAAGKNHLFDIDGGFAAFDVSNKLTIAATHCSDERQSTPLGTTVSEVDGASRAGGEAKSGTGVQAKA